MLFFHKSQGEYELTSHITHLSRSELLGLLSVKVAKDFLPYEFFMAHFIITFFCFFILVLSFEYKICTAAFSLIRPRLTVCTCWYLSVLIDGYFSGIGCWCCLLLPKRKSVRWLKKRQPCWRVEVFKCCGSQCLILPRVQNEATNKTPQCSEGYLSQWLTCFNLELTLSFIPWNAIQWCWQYSNSKLVNPVMELFQLILETCTTISPLLKFSSFMKYMYLYLFSKEGHDCIYSEDAASAL